MSDSTVSVPVRLARFGAVPDRFELDRLSIELTNLCAKGCAFCYNTSNPLGATEWTVDEVVGFVADCAANGVNAASFGGGEPLQCAGLYDVLEQLEGTVFRSFTTNGLLLDENLDRVCDAAPDKVHVSVHFPGRDAEVTRVIRQVRALADAGISSGVNLLVRRSELAEAATATQRLYDSGIGPERIVFLPMRGADTPTPTELGRVAGRSGFQSMTCLTGCAASPRFASVGWDKRVGWCSYTTSRRTMPSLDHAGLSAALRGVALATC